MTVPQQLTVDSLLKGTPLSGSVSLPLHDAVLWPAADPDAFADAAAFSERRVADAVEEALRWVASDAWRTVR